MTELVCSDCVIAVAQGEQKVKLPVVHICEFCKSGICCEHAIIDENRPYCTDCVDYWCEVGEKLLASVGIAAE
ncbi:MAG: hypothetical protein ACXWQ5_00960 [Ktedonobacterales bacterium]